ncbi:Dolichyl-diphosphooligosaccharide-protein glycosyltransferase 48kDa subunit [Hanseniaspora valbyensis NRRL Y-1626]|uniref:Dolichyl-diphosphooligosaccharide--protein glycosyltransferase subunit WBP1 n=1 Tax=Hanseniaspora valbyensis NRRL Y-1626 TaxID=766949 RepID=A0A1B7THY8_9ASCO|nr:Dolichyl-diphosphooligosaccharide-protein glycosyltransferase 48kDa subunit [Hanseniaspora valbyensis NRRL Y-1626]
MISNLFFSKILFLCSLFLSCLGKTVLFLHDNASDSELTDYSTFINYLTKERNYDLTLKTFKDDSLSLLSDDLQVNKFDEIIIGPITSTKLKNFNEGQLLQFYENGGNLLILGSSTQSNNNPIRKFLNNIGIYPSPKGYITEDFEDSNTSDLIISDGSLFLNDYIFENKNNDKSITLKDSSSALIDTNEMIFPVVRQSDYMKNSNKDNTWSLSKQGYLAVAFQNLKNNRIAWIASDSLITNEGIEEKDNFEFIKEITKWTFQEKSILNVLGFDHYQLVQEEYYTLDEEKQQNVLSTREVKVTYGEEPYKVKDFVNVDLFLQNLKDVDNSGNAIYEPFFTDDIQFELRMIDPYYRLNLNLDEENSTHYKTGKFALPDHHGVFTFNIKYQRKGLSYIDVKDVKAIRNLAHTEYPRSFEIRNSWVYMSTIFSVIFLWIVFVILFIITSKRVNTTIIKADKKKN